MTTQTAAGAAAGSDAGGTDDGKGGAGGTGSGAGGSGGSGSGRQAPWTAENFDADRAARLLERTTADATAAKARADAAEAKLQEAERAKLDDLGRAKAEADDYKGKLTASESRSLRLEVILEAAPDDMSAKRAAQLAKRLTGSTRAELEADAVELIAEFGGGKGSTSTGKAPVGGKPRERLVGGGNQDDDDEDDIDGMSDAELDKALPRR